MPRSTRRSPLLQPAVTIAVRPLENRDAVYESQLWPLIDHQAECQSNNHPDFFSKGDPATLVTDIHEQITNRDLRCRYLRQNGSNHPPPAFPGR
jgi:hypothetical protein